MMAVYKRLVFPSFNHFKRLVARAGFTEFSRRWTFTLYGQPCVYIIIKILYRNLQTIETSLPNKKSGQLNQHEGLWGGWLWFNYLRRNNFYPIATSRPVLWPKRLSKKQKGEIDGTEVCCSLPSSSTMYGTLPTLPHKSL